ncbi:MAG: zinc ribbon domain-containing protein [Deltaproteobacteria bacterium]|nr:zinc ribbon domain-containing protein [Deltaproteobacteria bacterium]MBW2139010.1 zinc ribbon domain-containing protein [Deltaproteobacteria bacterium]
MPIYEYKCNRCDHVFEQLVFSTDPEERPVCPSCGGDDTCKLMSSFSCSSNSELTSSCSAPSGGFS